MKQPRPKSVVAQKIHEIINEESEKEPLGHLRDFHVTWMLEFTKWLFDAPVSAISIDVEKKLIILSPKREDEKYFKKADYEALSLEKKAGKLAREMPQTLGIEEYRVEFRRTQPRPKQEASEST